MQSRSKSWSLATNYWHRLELEHRLRRRYTQNLRILLFFVYSYLKGRFKASKILLQLSM